MEKKFSTKWKASLQPRKQRKYIANAPLHLRKKFVHIGLSKELRKKYKKRNLQAKKGDVVKIMKGKFRGKTGKILNVNLKTSKIIVEGMQVKKQDGSKANVKMRSSNLQIVELAERSTKKMNAEKIQGQKTKQKNQPSTVEEAKNK